MWFKLLNIFAALRRQHQLSCFLTNFDTVFSNCESETTVCRNWLVNEDICLWCYNSAFSTRQCSVLNVVKKKVVVSLQKMTVLNTLGNCRWVERDEYPHAAGDEECGHKPVGWVLASTNRLER